MWPATDRSDFRVLRHLKGVVHLDSEVANGALDLGVAKKQLHCAKVVRPPIDQCRLRSAHAVGHVGVAHAAKTRNLVAGTIVGSGTVANQDESVGASCLAEKRMLEIIRNGKPSTPFLRYGQQVRIEMFDDAGNSLFGAIDQEIVAYRV